MPNWCYGMVRVKGAPKNIENFCKLFLFDNAKDTSSGVHLEKKYFARSFAFMDWKSFKSEYLKGNDIEFGIDFAWSCYSCLVTGYPNNKELVTLEWACKKHNVQVWIESEEPGLGFEETLYCDKRGLSHKEKDIPTYECINCGSEQFISSSCDMENEHCYDCESLGEWKNEGEKEHPTK